MQQLHGRSVLRTTLKSGKDTRGLYIKGSSSYQDAYRQERHKYSMLGWYFHLLLELLKGFESYITFYG